MKTLERALPSLLAAVAIALSLPAVAVDSSAYTCADCPQRIPDAGGESNPASVVLSVAANACAGGAAIGGVDVRVDLLHSHVGDLSITLASPGGTRYSLLERLADASGTPGSCASDDVRAEFGEPDEDAVIASCVYTLPAVGGVIQPASTLAALSGPIEPGTWTLEVADHADAGDGVVRDFALRFYCSLPRRLFEDGFEEE